ncbi:riboflavin synthase alpha chain [Desulfatibacillum alkenivorans DSM 16219]|jgi:riboflavin synthase|uniref:Riboflavin synthase n=1 Tax=Desulfatibacillum alkenivorans DSM 16219 TaxID=1121393 RepID=A0A1M6WML3_9BACT|nr:riboflavin synthase [Desulfatibacillum alkenivorans]SHK94839.1 riboflavin synthase alpha chain [Desulfatibacillum alkenivorans DSM 16219]
MFTGIIEGLGTLKRINKGRGVTMQIQADFDLTGVKLGDSIAVSGTCLTATRLDGSTFDVDVSPETISRSILHWAKPGDRVNLERALTFASRLDGHLVQGHVDGIATVSSVKADSNAILYSFEAPPSLTYYMVEKGSVAIDGISLTINQRSDTGFSVSIIPHTAKITTIGLRKPGDRVNIETDIIGKYVEHFLSATRGEADKNSQMPGINMELLAKNGFL